MQEGEERTAYFQFHNQGEKKNIPSEAEIERVLP